MRQNVPLTLFYGLVVIASVACAESNPCPQSKVDAFATGLGVIMKDDHELGQRVESHVRHETYDPEKVRGFATEYSDLQNRVANLEAPDCALEVRRDFMDYFRYEQQAMEAGADGDFDKMDSRISLARDSWYQGYEAMQKLATQP